MCALAIWVQCMYCVYLSIDGPGVKVLWGAGQPELLLRQLNVGCRRGRNGKSALHSLQLPQFRLPHGGASVAVFRFGASVAWFLLLGASVASFFTSYSLSRLKAYNFFSVLHKIKFQLSWIGLQFSLGRKASVLGPQRVPVKSPPLLRYAGFFWITSWTN